MFEKIKKELGFVNASVMMQMKNGKTHHGVIVDFIDNPNYQADYWKFVSNYDILKYEQTENPKLVQVVPVSEIAYIDAYLK